MEKLAGAFAVLGALLVANVSMSRAETENAYFTAGGELRLRPVTGTGQITSIVWKYGKDLVAEWAEGSIDLAFYNKFKDRSELNTTTGVLVVRQMTAADNGLYSVEINNQVQSRVHQTVQIGTVPRPVVYLQPLACNRTQLCGLKCDGDVAGAEPVTFFWKSDDGQWERGADRKQLSREEMDRVKTFTCRMKNPVSEEDSEPFTNPFYQEMQPSGGAPVGAIVGGMFGVLAVILIGLCVWKKDYLSKKFQSLTSAGKSTPEEKADNQEPLNPSAEGKPSPPHRDDASELKEVKPDSNDGK